MLATHLTALHCSGQQVVVMQALSALDRGAAKGRNRKTPFATP
jgi:hypothetical protein